LLIFINTSRIQTLILISSNNPTLKWWYNICYLVTGCRCHPFNLLRYRRKAQIVLFLDLWTWLHDRLKFQDLANRSKHKSLSWAFLSSVGSNNTFNALKCI
jgi:hypothetical protein